MTITSMEPGTSSSISSVRTTKRKFEDAIRTLDSTVVPPSPAISACESPTPSKRPHLTRSVYSALKNFGTTSRGRSRPSSDSTSNVLDVSKSAPRLAAILARSASRFKQTPSFSHLSTLTAHPVSEYRPSSTDSFLYRLATYKITTYANKPPQIDAVAAARCGWINDGKDRLVCGICDISWVLAGREGMNKDAASMLIEKQRASLVEMHKDGCPWKDRQCDPSVYRVPLQAPTAMVNELRAVAFSLEPMLTNVLVKHPLAPSQLSSLRSIFSTAVSERWASEHDPVDETTRPSLPTDIAITVALFGWVPASAATRGEFGCTPSLSISRTLSHGPSASMPPTPSRSRANSVSSLFQGAAGILLPSASTRMRISEFEGSPVRATISSRTRNPCPSNVTATVPRDTSLIYCTLCLRRVGLWVYSRSEANVLSAQTEGVTSETHEHHKEFDLVKEHRSYCPYVVCSSVAPSFSYPPVVNLGNAAEGWRVVLAVVQRYELSRRQRLSRFLPSDDPDNQACSAELKGVEAMVAGVKTNGGGELLRYVKGLLG